MKKKHRAYLHFKAADDAWERELERLGMTRWDATSYGAKGSKLERVFIWRRTWMAVWRYYLGIRQAGFRHYIVSESGGKKDGV